MSSLVIDPEKCTRDGLCMLDCPARLFARENPGDIPQWIENAEDQCIKCGHCMAICSHGALSVKGVKVEDCPEVSPGDKLTPLQVEKFLRSRRTVRQYLDEPVAEEKIKALLNIARFAPTGGNSQLIKWLVINSPEKIRDIGQEVIDFFTSIMKTDHPMNKRYRVAGFIRAWKKGFDPITRNAPSLVLTYAPEEYVTGDADSTIALTYLELAAPSFGIGTCWAGFVMRALKEWPPLQKKLDLPEGYAALGAMMMGYQKYPYHRLPVRDPADITIR